MRRKQERREREELETRETRAWGGNRGKDKTRRAGRGTGAQAGRKEIVARTGEKRSSEKSSPQTNTVSQCAVLQSLDERI